jgi:uncharacterized protein (TIGR00255 family)
MWRNKLSRRFSIPFRGRIFMILSMTGFGSGRAETPSFVISVEVKAVNHRYLDFHVRLGPEYQSLEPVVRKAVTTKLRRGRVDAFIKIDRVRSEIRIDSDTAVISAYVDLIEDLKSRFPISGELTVETLSRLPGAIELSGTQATPEQQQALTGAVEAATTSALDELCLMRAREGEALVTDLRSRLGTIRRNLETISGCATALLAHYRELLVNRVAELAPNLPVDSNRLEIEALIHAEKSDIAEEITRLGSHLNQFDAVLDENAEAGKRMDFLLQEMNREVSTILSKTSGLNQTGASIGQSGINIKVEIDKLREQVQNIE